MDEISGKQFVILPMLYPPWEITPQNKCLFYSEWECFKSESSIKEPMEKFLPCLSFRKNVASPEQTVCSKDTVNQVTVSPITLAIGRLREMNSCTGCHSTNSCQLILLNYCHNCLQLWQSWKRWRQGEKGLKCVD